MAVHEQSCAASPTAAGVPAPVAWPQAKAMLWQTVIDNSSTDWVVSLRARTTPPNRAFMDEKTLSTLFRRRSIR